MPRKTSAQLDREIDAALANVTRRGPNRRAHAKFKGAVTDTTDQLLAFLAEHGFVGARANPRSLRVGDDIVFVKERSDDSGSVEITLSHPPKGGRAQTYHQRFSARSRALTELKRAAELAARFAKKA
jgi:hypothetical protein